MQRLPTEIEPSARFKLNPGPERTVHGQRERLLGETIFMYAFKLICLTIFNLLKQAWHLPQLIAGAAQARRRQACRADSEAERLDRIRNPRKYEGR